LTAPGSNPTPNRRQPPSSRMSSFNLDRFRYEKKRGARANGERDPGRRRGSPRDPGFPEVGGPAGERERERRHLPRVSSSPNSSPARVRTPHPTHQP
ncbi:hypothetical protein chiPu_0031800, partial [Chiloscyllium punctatum]|nr:hypothetical protein [Chiloscyllium punctatum]